MKVLVLGGHGFVGKHVMKMIEGKHEAVAASRRDGLDMTDLPATINCLRREKPDVVVNCAAHVGSLHYVSEFAASVVDENMRIILNLYKALKEAAPNARVINPISNCSYPGDAEVHSEPGWWSGAVHESVWSYANPRRMMAVVSDCYARQHGIKSVNYLVANSYGPDDYTDPNKTHALNGMMIRMLKAKQKGEKKFEIWGTGKPVREWIFVKDVAKMLAYAIDHETDLRPPINIAQNKAYAIRETAEMIKRSIEFEGELVFDASKQDGAPRKILDDRLFRKRYPKFEFTPIEAGIKETAAYYKKALEIDS